MVMLGKACVAAENEKAGRALVEHVITRDLATFKKGIRSELVPDVKLFCVLASVIRKFGGSTTVMNRVPELIECAVRWRVHLDETVVGILVAACKEHVNMTAARAILEHERKGTFTVSQHHQY